MRTPVGAQCNRLGIGNQARDGESQRRLDHLRQARGDIVEASGVDRHRVARAVDLHSRTVQLGFENSCATETFERLGHAGRSLGEHRADRLADFEGELLQRRLTGGQRGGRDGGQGTAEHGRAPHRRGRDVGGLGDRVGHHPEQRPLAEFTAEQPAQERLLGVGGPAEQSGDQLGPSSLRSLARHRADLAEPGVDVEDGQERLRGRGRQRTQRGPADADLPLGQLAGQPGHDYRDKLRVAVLPARRSRSAILAILASRDEEAPTSADVVATSRQLHDLSLARASDISEQVGEHSDLGAQQAADLRVGQLPPRDLCTPSRARCRAPCAR